jgi:hypothetical protein
MFVYLYTNKFKTFKMVLTTLTLRFQKTDAYQNSIFIASGTNPAEKESYDMLTKFSKQLQSLKYGTFLPIYHNNTDYNYATVRTMKNMKFKNLSENAVYKVTFDCKKRVKNDKSYINCHLGKLELLKLAEVHDEGSDIDFD